MIINSLNLTLIHVAAAIHNSSTCVIEIRIPVHLDPSLSVHIGLMSTMLKSWWLSTPWCIFHLFLSLLLCRSCFLFSFTLCSCGVASPLAEPSQREQLPRENEWLLLKGVQRRSWGPVSENPASQSGTQRCVRRTRARSTLPYGLQNLNGLCQCVPYPIHRISVTPPSPSTTPDLQPEHPPPPSSVPKIRARVSVCVWIYLYVSVFLYSFGSLWCQELQSLYKLHVFK